MADEDTPSERDEPQRRGGGSIKDAALTDAHGAEGAGAGPDAQSASTRDTQGDSGVPQDIGGGGDLGNPPDRRARRRDD